MRQRHGQPSRAAAAPVNTPVAIFIDSVDEYFNRHIEAVRRRASDAGELSPDIWHFSQMGLVEVAYQLRRDQPSPQGLRRGPQGGVRAAAQTTSMGQQYRGSTVDIGYPVESLREIFVNNIRREKDRNGASASCCAPIRSRRSSAARA